MGSPELTQMLQQLEAGGRAAVDALLPHVYEQLRALAHRQLRAERADHTLNTTALVHEAYLKLAAQDRVSWQNRAHFMGVAALAMRRLLVDHAHRVRTAKRGGGVALLTWTDGVAAQESDADGLLALHERAAGTRRRVPAVRRTQRARDRRSARRFGADRAAGLARRTGVARERPRLITALCPLAYRR
jgi:RNA polymerase sigma factor (TIGR02999 family)